MEQKSGILISVAIAICAFFIWLPKPVQTVPAPIASTKQCNPVFNRGDIVRHRGLPEQNYIVVWMDIGQCNVIIRHPSLVWFESGADLLEKVPTIGIDP